MKSIQTKITAMTVSVIVIAMMVATFLGVRALRNLGNIYSRQLLSLLCESGEKNLDSYFESVEQAVAMVSAYVESDLTGIEDDDLDEHLNRVSDIFKKMTYKTNGILTYYYRIDPKISTRCPGFWYVLQEDGNFKRHEATDITQYNTEDTSKLVWFTVPKATGNPVWLPPYITDNLGARVISYNVPVYLDKRFVGVIGIEIDYATMAEQVNNITLYDTGYAFINDKEGNIICHPLMSVDKITKNPPKVPEGLLSEDPFVRYNYNGVEKVATWQPLKNGMQLYVTAPQSEVDAVWMRWGTNIVVLFGIMLILFIAIILHFTGRITKPLRDLTAAAEQVNAGNYDFDLDYEGRDEVGVLTGTFRRLTSHLKTYIGNLNDLAYADALTSVRNKGAFDLYVQDIQEHLHDTSPDTDFAICIFDCNNLKDINDTYGHDKGNIYLQVSCKLICNVFEHSPVFRIGGDEFAVVLHGQDYMRREELLHVFDDACAATRSRDRDIWEQVDVARGLAVYDPDSDSSIHETVRRADRLMYEHKWELKNRHII